jgi:hypothetical protein
MSEAKVDRELEDLHRKYCKSRVRRLSDLPAHFMDSISSSLWKSGEVPTLRMNSPGLLLASAALARSRGEAADARAPLRAKVVESVAAGIASADAGRLIPEEEVLTWLAAPAK